MADSNAQPPATLEKSDQNLVWLDCEMTGLDPERDRIIEIAVVVTGPHLEPRIEGPAIAIHQSEAQLDLMDAWNKGTHGKSGLTDKVRASTVTEAEAEGQVLEFIQDRRFLVKYMPAVEGWFHYRNLDVSTLKELARRWRPEVHTSFKKRQLHTALADVHESIDELAHYREHFLRLA
jgi:oligoribonuclease